MSVSKELPLNTSEVCAQLCAAGIRAHRGIPREILDETLMKVVIGEIVPEVSNPVDVLREEVMRFIAIHKEAVLPQLGCDGNCYNHPDAQVVHCYLQTRGALV